MVNFSLNAGSLMGIILAFAGAGLYFLRSFRPNLARDYDVFFAAIALICGGILFFQSWRLDPILQFGVFLLAGSTVFFAVDSIRLRDIATEQAKRNTPLVDDDRPVSRSYQYQSEDYGPGYGSFDAQRPSNARRIRGSRDFQEGGYEDGNGWGDSDRRDNRRQPRSLDWGRDRDPDRADAGRVRTRRAALERPDYGSDYGDAWDAPSPGPGNGPPYGGAGGGRAGAGYEGGYGEGDWGDRGRNRGDRGRNRGDRPPGDYSEWGYGPGEASPRSAPPQDYPGDYGAGYAASSYPDGYNRGYEERSGVGAAGPSAYPEGSYSSDPAAYGTPLTAAVGTALEGDLGGEYAGGIDPTEDPSVYGSGGSGAYDSSYGGGSYGGGSYGSGSYGGESEGGYGEGGYGAGDDGGRGEAARSDDRASGDPNRRPRRRPPSTLMSRSPYGEDEF